MKYSSFKKEIQSVKIKVAWGDEEDYNYYYYYIIILKVTTYRSWHGKKNYMSQNSQFILRCIFFSATKKLYFLTGKILLIHLLTVVADHRDHLGVARVLLNNKTTMLGYGLIPNNIFTHNKNFTGEKTELLLKYLLRLWLGRPL